MAKTPLEVKNLIEVWAKEWGCTVKDITSLQGNAPVEWILEISNGRNAVLALTETRLKDVLRFQTQINFLPEHKEKTVQLRNEDYNMFVLEMTDRLANLGCDWIFDHDQQNPKQMNSLRMTYFVTYEKIDRDIILQMLSRAIINLTQMVRAISITLGKDSARQSESTSSSSSIYS